MRIWNAEPAAADAHDDRLLSLSPLASCNRHIVIRVLVSDTAPAPVERWVARQSDARNPSRNNTTFTFRVFVGKVVSGLKQYLCCQKGRALCATNLFTSISSYLVHCFLTVSKGALRSFPAPYKDIACAATRMMLDLSCWSVMVETRLFWYANMKEAVRLISIMIIANIQTLLSYHIGPWW